MSTIKMIKGNCHQYFAIATRGISTDLMYPQLVPMQPPTFLSICVKSCLHMNYTEALLTTIIVCSLFFLVGYSLHYCNNNSANSYYSTYPSWAHPNYDVYHRPHLNGHTTFPPTPSPSPGPRPIDSRTPRTTNVSDVDDEEEEDDEYKPYCDSKRGEEPDIVNYKARVCVCI